MWGFAALLLCASASPAADVVEAIAIYNAASPRPIQALNQRDLRALDAGKVVRRYIPPSTRGGAAGVFGAIVAEVPRTELWLTIRDGDLAVSDGLTEALISGRYNELDQVWFGMLKLPSPFRTRHWRIHTRTDAALARKTNGRAWESTWTRVKNGDALNRRDAAAGKLKGVSVDELDRAIYTVENRGSWLVIELDPRRSLVVYRGTADLGGVIPREIVNGFARMRLRQLLQGTVDQVVFARPHYVDDHPPILAGDGQPIPRFKTTSAR